MPFRRLAIHRIALVISMAIAGGTVRADSLFDDPDSRAPQLPLNRSASVAARQELAAARLTLTRARMSYATIQRTAEIEFRNAAGFRTLQITAARAVSDYQIARRTALAGLSKDAEYRELQRQREALRAEIRRVASQSKDDLDPVLPLANRALATNERLTRAESIALALNPAVEDARGVMTDAFASLRRVTMTARARAEEFPMVAAAREDITQARQRISVANFNLVNALRAEVTADRNARAQRARRS